MRQALREAEAKKQALKKIESAKDGADHATREAEEALQAAEADEAQAADEVQSAQAAWDAQFAQLLDVVVAEDCRVA